MKYIITLAPNEWEDIYRILIEAELRAEQEIANPDLACIKSFNERDAARAKELRIVFLERRLYEDEDEEEAST